MIENRMIENRIERIQNELKDLEKYRKLSFDQLAKDHSIHKTIERTIEIIVNAAIDINQHIIVASGKGELPFDFKQSFLILSDLDIYPRDFAGKIGNSVGLRNILVHEYEKLDEQKFYDSIEDCYKDYTKYCRYILDYLSPTKII